MRRTYSKPMFDFCNADRHCKCESEKDAEASSDNDSSPELVDSSESEGAAPTPTRPRVSRRRSLRERRATSRSSGSESDCNDTTAHNNWNRETLVPTSIENTALQVLKYMRPQPNINFASGQGSIQPADDGRAETRTHLGTSSAIDRAASGCVGSDFGILKSHEGKAGISTLIPVMRQGISVVRRPDEWTQITVTVDSGACVSVMPVGTCEGISILENEWSRGGAEYEVANGATIPNLGERRCEVMTVGSQQAKMITFQVADVHKPLLSISACADMGFDCFLGKEGGQLRDKITGEKIPLERHGSLYTMQMWVRQDPSVNVSSPFAGPV